jgi:hypothetical protein
MKLENTHWWSRIKLIGLAIAITTIVVVGTSRGGEICDCESPPGGQVRCEVGQAAFCTIKDGKVVAVCKKPPPSQSKGLVLYAWVLSQVTGTTVDPQDIEKNALQKNILKTGKFTNPKTGEVIRFTIPKETDRFSRPN